MLEVIDLAHQRAIEMIEATLARRKKKLPDLAKSPLCVDAGGTLVAWVVVFAVSWIAHARGLKYAGERLSAHPAYARLSTLAVAFVSLVLTLATIDGWTIARYVGGQGAGTSAWADPVFQKSLAFYFFELPFYKMHHFHHLVFLWVP